MQMSDKKSNTHDDSPNKPPKRNLPSWMSARDTATDEPPRKKSSDGSASAAAHQEENEGKKKSTESTKPRAKTHNGVTGIHSKGKAAANVDSLSFSNLLDGVVFVLSGFVNPERSTLRSQAQAMGAEYQPDWNSNCTLLICAFPNTPKFRQVEADCGTIVSKEWISECYSQKKLVAIETYLMHAGKPWRKSGISHEATHDSETTTPEKKIKKAERSLHSKSPVSASSKGGAPTENKERSSPAEVKKWAISDLSETTSWLENQEERPEPNQVKRIAAEGILTCLQDAIDSLEKKQGIGQATEQWNFIPRVVKELIKLEELKHSKKELYQQALSCKKIYQTQFEEGEGDKDIKITDVGGYDSDDTVEMTEDEIDIAYKTVSSKLKS